MAITAADAIKAIKGVPGDQNYPPSGGYVSVIAARLGCSQRHVYNLKDKYASVAEAIAEERERQKDYAEGQLQSLIKDKNPTAIIFYLKTQAKERGYVERQEVRALNIDVTTLSNEQLERIAAGEDIAAVLATTK